MLDSLHGLLTFSLRQVLVSLLDMPNRLDWKACLLSEADDRADAESFKIAFAPFNSNS